jgi:hypothetical protein
MGSIFRSAFLDGFTMAGAFTKLRMPGSSVPLFSPELPLHEREFLYALSTEGLYDEKGQPIERVDVAEPENEDQSAHHHEKSPRTT